MSDLKIDDVPIDEMEATVLEGLVKMTTNGSVPAAAACLAAIERARKARAGEQHRLTMDSFGKDTAGLCKYLATIGTPLSDVEAYLGRLMSAKERTAYISGDRERRMEARAIELHRMRRGEAPPPKWADKKHSAG